MDKTDYTNKMNPMIENGLDDGTYAESEDTTIEDLRYFKDFFI